MKRIIAAALSILVGAFGYTIVDSAIEARVATLESEVFELREEVSRNSCKEESDNETSTSDIEKKKLKVGQFMNESYRSRHKFLIREYSNGRIEYRSPDSFGRPFLQPALIFMMPDPCLKVSLTATICNITIFIFAYQNPLLKYQK